MHVSPKPSLHSACTSRYYRQLCFRTNPSEQVHCSLSNIIVHVNQLPTSVWMQIDSVGARESASSMSTQMPAMLEDSQSVPSLSIHSSPADVHFFHFSETEMVSKHHHWSSHPQIPWLLPLSSSSFICPQYHFSPVVTYHPFLEIFFFWTCWHHTLLDLLPQETPVSFDCSSSLATWRNLITTHVMIVKFSIYSLAYCFLLFPRNYFVDSMCIIQMYISKGTFFPIYIPTSN